MNKQINFRHIPFFRLLIPFICGICSCYFIDFEFVPVSNFVALFLFLISIFLLSPFIFRLSAMISGFAVAFSFFLTGFFIMYLSSGHSSIPSDRYSYSGIIFSAPLVKEKTTRIECRLISYHNAKINKRVTERIVLYIQNDSSITPPYIGDSVFFYASIQIIGNNSNPGEFNFARFMKDKGIIYSAFVRKEEIKFGGNSNLFTIRRLASQVQLFIENKFRDFSMEGQELAVISALFAGDRSMLDEATTKSYISSGAVHILSVSGLHVGILFMFLTVIFGKKNTSVLYSVLRLIIILSVIWFYAFITGLSPSVIRASVMFSLFLTGKSFNRQINSYNILSCSALLILLFDPAVLFQIGFQLSYLAVLGIFLFQPKIAGFFDFENSLIDRIWQLTSVGIAAQLATFPLSLYYFHQFPVYFWFTNILVIPVTWLVMMGTMLFFVVLPLPGIAGLVSSAIKAMLILMNYMVTAISQLPFSTAANIRFGSLSLILFSITLIGSMVIYRYGKKKNVLWFFACALILLFTSGMLKYLKDEKKKEIIVYNSRRGISLSIIDGHKHLLLGNNESIDNYGSLSSRLNNFWVERNIQKEISVINIDTVTAGDHFYSSSIELFRDLDGLYIAFENRCFFIPDKNCKTGYSLNYQPKLYAKYFLIVSDSVNSWKIDKVRYKIEKIIVAETMQFYRKEKWKNISAGYKIAYYDVTREGAYRLNTEIQ